MGEPRAGPRAARATRGATGERGGLAEVEWRISTARSGEPTLEVAGHAVHSRYAPGREAEAITRETAAALRRSGADLVVLLGLGLGHLPRALARATRARILAFDPFPELTRALSVEVGDAGTGRLRVESRPERLEAELAAGLARGLRPHVLVHPGYTEICRFERRLVARALRRGIGAAPAGPASAVVSRRALDALLRWPRLGRLSDLSACCAGRSAILVAPGPTLEAALPALARRRGGVVFAAIQALRRLQDAGVRVDFAVAPDPLHSTPFVADFEPVFGALLAEAGVEPALLDRWPARTHLFPLRSEQLYDWAWRAAGEEPWDEPLNTVSETALLLAHRLGARRFVLVGIDLCGREKGEFAARRASGTPELTNAGYWHAGRYLGFAVPRLAREGCRIWRVGDGLPIAGSEPLAVEELAGLLAADDGFAAAAPRDRGADPARLAIARELLARAADAAPAARDRGAAPDVEAANRWSPFAALPAAERPAACRAALRALDQPA